MVPAPPALSNAVTASIAALFPALLSVKLFAKTRWNHLRSDALSENLSIGVSFLINDQSRRTNMTMLTWLGSRFVFNYCMTIWCVIGPFTTCWITSFIFFHLSFHLRINRFVSITSSARILLTLTVTIICRCTHSLLGLLGFFDHFQTLDLSFLSLLRCAFGVTAKLASVIG